MSEQGKGCGDQFSLYSSVAASINQYVLDIGRKGYWVTVHTIHGGTPAHIRAYLTAHNPVGALLVGPIVAPWYDIHGDQFPCDLYYMDTNGA